MASNGPVEYITYDDIVPAPETQDYLNQILDNLNTVTGYMATNFINIAPPPVNDPNRPPSLNDRLCAKVMDANWSLITLALLERAYVECIPQHIRTDPDRLWVGRMLYMALRDLLIQQPAYIREWNGGDFFIVYRNAVIKMDNSIPLNEIIMYNSNYPEYSIRIINLSHQ